MASRRELAALASELIGTPSSCACPPAWSSMSWTDYMLTRGWLNSHAFSSAHPTAQDAAVSLLSSALSFPLTVANAWSELGVGKTPTRLHVVGARAEASLPMHFWSELCVLTGAERLTLEMSGPASARAGVAQRRRQESPAMEILLAQPSGTLLHRSELGLALLQQSSADASSAPHSELAQHSELQSPDAWLLFNPGVCALCVCMVEAVYAVS